MMDSLLAPTIWPMRGRYRSTNEIPNGFPSRRGLRLSERPGFRDKTDTEAMLRPGQTTSLVVGNPKVLLPRGARR